MKLSCGSNCWLGATQRPGEPYTSRLHRAYMGQVSQAFNSSVNCASFLLTCSKRNQDKRKSIQLVNQWRNQAALTLIRCYCGSYLLGCHSCSISVFSSLFSFVIGSETEVVIPVDAKIEAIVHFDWISPNKKIILNSAIKKKQKNLSSCCEE